MGLHHTRMSCRGVRVLRAQSWMTSQVCVLQGCEAGGLPWKVSAAEPPWQAEPSLGCVLMLHPRCVLGSAALEWGHHGACAPRAVPLVPQEVAWEVGPAAGASSRGFPEIAGP